MSKIDDKYHVETRSSGRMTYTKNGRYHRLDGPATISYSGNKYWYQDGLLHRNEGPAVEYVNGSKIWYQNNEYHRLDGPAVDWFNGPKYWWVEGKKIDCKTQEEFERLMKLKAFW